MSLNLHFLITSLIILLFLTAFFAAAETGMMALNPYRLKHLTKLSFTARLTEKLLKRPDRLLSLILIGNSFAAVCISTITTLFATAYFNHTEDFITTIFLTLIIIIISEIPAKTLAAMYPEKIAFPSAYLLQLLMWIFYPFIFFTNALSNGILKTFGFNLKEKKLYSLSQEELKTVVFEAGKKLPRKHRSMMLSIMDLEAITIDEIMVPRNEIVGIDLENDFESIVSQFESCQHTILPVYRSDLNNTEGVLHIKEVLNLMAAKQFTMDTLKTCIDESYFVPEGTSLATQLINFQKNKRRLALVVNEYGDVIGLVALEDILEEIVGEFTTDMAATRKDIIKQTDGSVVVEGSVNLRFLNRTLGWDLPLSGPKTLNGLIIEILEFIPEPGTCLLLGKYPVEIMQIQNNRVKTVRISPKL